MNSQKIGVYMSVILVISYLLISFISLLLYLYSKGSKHSFSRKYCYKYIVCEYRIFIVCSYFEEIRFSELIFSNSQSQFLSTGEVTKDGRDYWGGPL